jgi:hypothetical protein
VLFADVLTEISGRQPISVVGEATSPPVPGPSRADGGSGASPAGPEGDENGGAVGSAGRAEEEALEQILPPEIRDPPPGKPAGELQVSLREMCDWRYLSEYFVPWGLTEVSEKEVASVSGDRLLGFDIGTWCFGVDTEMEGRRLISYQHMAGGEQTLREG